MGSDEVTEGVGDCLVVAEVALVMSKELCKDLFLHGSKAFTSSVVGPDDVFGGVKN